MQTWSLKAPMLWNASIAIVTSLQKVEIGVLISCCKALMNNCNNFKVSFIQRWANRITHVLARVSHLDVGIQDFDYTSPYGNLILIEKMSPLLLKKSQQKPFFGEAIFSAIYKINFSIEIIIYFMNLIYMRNMRIHVLH